MEQQKESFISYRSFHEALKDLSLEQYGRVMYAINEYALYQNEIELSGIEKTCFILIKPQLDANIKRQDNGKYGNMGGRPKKTENAKGFNTSETKNPMGYFSAENKNPNDNDNENENENLNANENENLNANENEKERENSLSPESESEKMALINPNAEPDYARPIFAILKQADLPCCNKNFVSFLNRDWMNAKRILHSAELRGLHSDEVIAALENYVKVLENPCTWHGWKSRKSFDSFVSWERFKDFLPDRFCIDNFLEHTASPPKQARAGVGVDRVMQMIDEVGA